MSLINSYLIKLSAYESLIDARVSKLPVDMIEIFRNRDDVKLYRFSFFADVDGWDISTCKEAFGEYGTIIYNSDRNKFYAYYNDYNAASIIRWELANLLACFELGLTSTKFPILVECAEGDYTDTFAYYLTAPDAVLVAAKTTTASAIISACDIPFDKANRKSKKLKLYWAEKKIYLEDILKRNFREYINNLRFCNK